LVSLRSPILDFKNEVLGHIDEGEILYRYGIGVFINKIIEKLNSLTLADT